MAIELSSNVVDFTKGFGVLAISGGVILVAGLVAGFVNGWGHSLDIGLMTPGALIAVPAAIIGGALYFKGKALERENNNTISKVESAFNNSGKL